MEYPLQEAEVHVAPASSAEYSRWARVQESCLEELVDWKRVRWKNLSWEEMSLTLASEWPQVTLAMAEGQVMWEQEVIHSFAMRHTGNRVSVRL